MVFQEVCGPPQLTALKGKKCESGCGDQVKFTEKNVPFSFVVTDRNKLGKQ